MVFGILHRTAKQVNSINLFKNLLDYLLEFSIWNVQKYIKNIFKIYPVKFLSIIGILLLIIFFWNIHTKLFG